MCSWASEELFSIWIKDPYKHLCQILESVEFLLYSQTLKQLMVGKQQLPQRSQSSMHYLKNKGMIYSASFEYKQKLL